MTLCRFSGRVFLCFISITTTDDRQKRSAKNVLLDIKPHICYNMEEYYKSKNLFCMRSSEKKGY